MTFSNGRSLSLVSLVFATLFLVAANVQAEYLYGGATKTGCQERPVAVAKTAPAVGKAVPAAAIRALKTAQSTVPLSAVAQPKAAQYTAVKPALSRGNSKTAAYSNLAQTLSNSQEFQSIHSGYAPRQLNPSSVANRVSTAKNISAVLRPLK